MPAEPQEIVPIAAEKEYSSWLETIDPVTRPDVRFALATAPDKRFQMFLELLGSARNGKPLTLEQIAKKCSIGLMEFAGWWQKASTQRAIAIAQLKSAELAADMVEDARSTQAACDRCDGLTWITADDGLPPDTKGYRILRMVTPKPTKDNPDPEEYPLWRRDCPACDGLGKVRKIGDEFSREKSLELAGLVNKKGGGIAIINNFSGAGMPSAVSRLHNAMTIDVSEEG